MRKTIGVFLLSVLGCAAPLAQPASDWQAITLYPPAGIYQADFLPAMVAATESLWQVQDQQGKPVLKTIDSIASMNVIVAQDDEVRFRRIIELKELDRAGLQRMQTLVEQHPLVRRRLVTADGQATHIWLRPQTAVDQQDLQRLTRQLQQTLQQQLPVSCRMTDPQQGPLAGLYLSEWQFETTARPAGLQALRALDKAAQQLSVNTESDQVQLYSALSLLSYLGGILGAELLDKHGMPVSDMAVLQMYMLAESLRSRDLQALARPDFRQLQLVMLGHQQLPAVPELTGYQLSHTHHWQGTPEQYRILDCRPLTTVSAEN